MRLIINVHSFLYAVVVLNRLLQRSKRTLANEGPPWRTLRVDRALPALPSAWLKETEKANREIARGPTERDGLRENLPSGAAARSRRPY